MAATPGSTPPLNPAEPCFEDCLQNLENIVAALEAGEKPLEESLAYYEKGVAALKRCHELLDKAEQRIRLLISTPNGTPALRDAELETGGMQVAGGSPRNTAKIQTALGAPLKPLAAGGLEAEIESGTGLDELTKTPPASPARPAPEKRSGRPPARRGGDNANTLFRG